MSIIVWLILGAIAGWIAGKIVPGDEGYGVIGTIIAGVVGALLGGFLIGMVTGEEFMDELTIGSIIAAIVGAVIVVYLWGMIAKGRSGRTTT
jgi:uncharacterized membrane protein YeaQ/YmgE (transglycosylase-associated protein family)